MDELEHIESSSSQAWGYHTRYHDQEDVDRTIYLE